MNIGSRVSVRGDIGTVRFLGQTEFAPGSWVGVELDSPKGKNDGSVQGVSYFECKLSATTSDHGNKGDLYGIFVRPGVVKLLASKSSQDDSEEEEHNIKNRYGSLLSSSVNGPRNITPTNTDDALKSRGPSRSESPTRQNMLSPPRRSISPSRQSISPSRQYRLASGSGDGGLRSPIRTTSISNQQLQPPVLLGPPPSLHPGNSTTTPRNRSPSDRSVGTRSPSSRHPLSGNNFNSPSGRISSAGSTGSTTLDDGSVPSALSRQVETLKSKLKIMERKRQEDREKILYMQSQNKTVGRLENIIKRLQLKLTPMHEEIKALRAKLQEAEQDNYYLANERNDEALELATVDKEIAEEKSENIALELDTLRRKFEQLQTECEILREENALYSSVTQEQNDDYNGGGVDIENNHAANATTILSLQKRSEKLEEALVRLRNISLSQETSYKEKITALEQDIKDLYKSQSLYDRTNEKLAQAEEVILNLKQQLDSALGAEDMIESLTEQNLELSEKCDELQSTIDELETLKELNDELETNHSHREKQLLTEIDYLQSLHKENKNKLGEMDERNGNLELAIIRFRELVAGLNTELANLKSSSEQIESVQDAKDHTKAILDLNLKLASSSIESKAKTMDLELHKFKSEQALEQLEIMKCYLPAEFSSDETSVNCLLLINKVVFQSSLIYSYFKDKTLESSNDNNYSVNIDICLSLIQIQALARKLADLINYANPEKFQSFSALHDQIEQIERSFASDIELLRRGDLSDEVYQKSLRSILSKITVLTDNYGDDIVVGSSAYISIIMIQALVELLNLSLSIDKEGDFKNRYHSSLQKAVDARQVISRLAGELKSSRKGHNDAAKVGAHDLDILQTIKEDLHRVLKDFISLHSTTDDDDESNNKTPDNDGDNRNDRTDKESKGDNDKVENLNGIINFDKIDRLSGIFEHSPIVKLPSNPWVLKQQQIKELRSSQISLDRELEDLKYECQRLATQLRTKDRNIEELDVKVGLLNSKLLKSKEQDRLLSELKQSLSDSIGKEKSLNDHVSQLRKTVKEQERLLAKYKKSEIPGLKGDEILSAINLSALTLQREVKSLRSAVAYLSKENNKKSKMMAGPWLDPLPQQKPIYRSALYKACLPLFKDLRTAAMEYDIVSFEVSQYLWKSRRKDPKTQYLAQNEGLRIIQQDIENILKG